MKLKCKAMGLTNEQWRTHHRTTIYIEENKEESPLDVLPTQEDIREAHGKPT